MFYTKSNKALSKLSGLLTRTPSPLSPGVSRSTSDQRLNAGSLRTRTPCVRPNPLRPLNHHTSVAFESVQALATICYRRRLRISLDVIADPTGCVLPAPTASPALSQQQPVAYRLFCVSQSESHAYQQRMPICSSAGTHFLYATAFVTLWVAH